MRIPIHAKFLALVICAGAASASADPIDIAFTGSVKWAGISDRHQYLGPAGSTNPDYAVGLEVLDYFGDGYQPDGSYDLEQYRSIVPDISNQIAGNIEFELNRSAGISTSTSNYGGVFVQRSAGHPIENARYAFNLNIFGSDIIVGHDFDSVRAHSFEKRSRDTADTFLTLKHFLHDGDPVPPAFGFTLPAVKRHINATGRCCRADDNFEVIDGVYVDREYILTFAEFQFQFNDSLIRNLAELDPSEPALAGLLTGIRLRLQFSDAGGEPHESAGRLNFLYNLELASDNTVPTPGTLWLLAFALGIAIKRKTA